jgi:hypothetical protein
VDDLCFFFRKEYQQEFDVLITKLKDEIELTGGGELEWFLKIRVLRDRRQRKIWLVQDQYIEKLQNQYGIEGPFPHVPLPMSVKLQKADEGYEPSYLFRQNFQSKVGSVLYAAVITRADVFKTVTDLATYGLCPTQQHMDAIDYALRYLVGTKTYAVEYDGSKDGLECFSDAAFADNTETRKSSFGYVMMLFGGLIIWKAGKQDTVTTSTTEAELLALSSTAKEEYALFRLLDNLDLRLDDGIRLFYDNMQTIRLLTAETAVLTTRLRHVDIHRHWLRQEVQKQRLTVDWIGTNEMAADGMTKRLDRQKHQHFVHQIGLVDIADRIQAVWDAEDED